MRLPPELAVRARTLRPRIFAGEFRRVLGKLKRRLRAPEGRLARLEPVGEPRGEALFSFIADPFHLGGRRPSHDHTHDWESLEMARALAELGFGVDVIHWTNARFVPARAYDLFVDVRLNLERLAPLLPPSCVKVMHVETAHHAFHNAAQRRRLDALEARRGVRLPPYKMIEENRAIESADVATVLGNDFTQETYAFAGKPMYRVPISHPLPWELPRGKDFDRVRRRFLWFGSGGLVHKGLDLVLEAFAGMPDFELVVCGPIRRERPFEVAFYDELYRAPNIRTAGWVDVGGGELTALAETCLGLVYPSCSEGGGGSAITCMHAGLIPLLTREASVDLADDRGVLLGEPSVEGIRAAVRDLAALPTERLAAMAEASWRFANANHTRETFARGYRRAMTEILAAHAEASR